MIFSFSYKRGFTLIEMILYVAICSIILLALSSLSTFMLSGRVKSQTIADVNWQGEQVLRLITQTIRNARTVDLPSIGSTGTMLSITTLDPLQSPTVFSIASGTLFVTEGGGQAIPLTNSHVTVSSLSFQNVSSTSSSDRIVRVSFVVTYTNLSGRNEHEFSKAFKGSATLRQ